MTKDMSDVVVKKEATKKREKKNGDGVQEKSQLQQEVSVGGGSEDAKTQVVISEKLHVENAIEEKPKREKNTMPKKTAKKEQEVVASQ